MNSIMNGSAINAFSNNLIRRNFREVKTVFRKSMRFWFPRLTCNSIYKATKTYGAKEYRSNDWCTTVIKVNKINTYANQGSNPSSLNRLLRSLNCSWKYTLGFVIYDLWFPAWQQTGWIIETKVLIIHEPFNECVID